MIYKMGSNMGAAYQQDFYTWTLEQTSLLKQKRFDELDLEHIIEEMEDMGKSEKRALESYIENLLMHLLKWKYQPYYIGRRSWELTIIEQRKRLKWHIKENPGLKSKLPEAIERSYELAKLGAEKETGIPISRYPETCPWTYQQFTDSEFWPEAF
ncbi:DUF29 domain-containing protein [Candidatus Marithrix sp. Canyon 246]|uniref:DUF29 domain-containing protein n=2 Tax=Candidatus Marithrix sp. Canyon 246 TaxID=1827136 RepID=UPI00209B1E8F|nr:DUF29 domain-containing protein [Candidatus Marithrix sp. Canyon 246]